MRSFMGISLLESLATLVPSGTEMPGLKSVRNRWGAVDDGSPPQDSRYPPLLLDGHPYVVVSRVNDFDHAHDLAVLRHLNVEVADKVNAQNRSAAAVRFDGCDRHGARPGERAAFRGVVLVGGRALAFGVQRKSDQLASDSASPVEFDSGRPFPRQAGQSHRRPSLNVLSGSGRDSGNKCNERERGQNSQPRRSKVVVELRGVVVRGVLR